jgi:hypothetical protein
MAYSLRLWSLESSRCRQSYQVLETARFHTGSNKLNGVTDDQIGLFSVRDSWKCI